VDGTQDELLNRERLDAQARMFAAPVMNATLPSTRPVMLFLLLPRSLPPACPVVLILRASPPARDRGIGSLGAGGRPHQARARQSRYE
jgi:hypothetical protein